MAATTNEEHLKLQVHEAGNTRSRLAKSVFGNFVFSSGAQVLLIICLIYHVAASCHLLDRIQCLVCMYVHSTISFFDRIQCLVCACVHSTLAFHPHGMHQSGTKTGTQAGLQRSVTYRLSFGLMGVPVGALKRRLERRPRR